MIRLENVAPRSGEDSLLSMSVSRVRVTRTRGRKDESTRESDREVSERAAAVRSFGRQPMRSAGALVASDSVTLRPSRSFPTLTHLAKMDGAATLPDPINLDSAASLSSRRPTSWAAATGLHSVSSSSARSATAPRSSLVAGDARPDAIDLSHHLSDMAKSRLTSPLKVRLDPLSVAEEGLTHSTRSMTTTVAVRLHAAAWHAPPRRWSPARRALPLCAHRLLPRPYSPPARSRRLTPPTPLRLRRSPSRQRRSPRTRSRRLRLGSARGCGAGLPGPRRRTSGRCASSRPTRPRFSSPPRCSTVRTPPRAALSSVDHAPDRALAPLRHRRGPRSPRKVHLRLHPARLSARHGGFPYRHQRWVDRRVGQDRDDARQPGRRRPVRGVDLPLGAGVRHSSTQSSISRCLY